MERERDKIGNFIIISLKLIKFIVFISFLQNNLKRQIKRKKTVINMSMVVKC